MVQQKDFLKPATKPEDSVPSTPINFTRCKIKKKEREKERKKMRKQHQIYIEKIDK